MARLLIANRGEIAIRIARAGRALGHTVIAVAPKDDLASRHTVFGDEVAELPGLGARAYLDVDAMVACAKDARADLIHPGYGFLSENAAFADACKAAGINLIGPGAEVLRALGDKSTARAIAERAGVPVPRGLVGPITLEDAKAFLRDMGPGGAIMLKAVMGGGGRGTRPVADAAELETTFVQCQAEAQAAFGDSTLYVEELIIGARHIEVQVIADGAGGFTHAFERECTLQRSRQKLIEVAPSPSIDQATRQGLIDASLAIARDVSYCGLGTFEFLVQGGRFTFIEANPRLQVEHTVTEEVTGLDLVQTQIRIAEGARLPELRLDKPLPLNGCAMQARINAEVMNADGSFASATGEITAFDLPTGPGVRVDTHGRTGTRPNPSYDSLLAKLILHSASTDYAALAKRMDAALEEFRITGCSTNKAFLRALLARADVQANDIDTAYVDRVLSALLSEVRPEEEGDATPEAAVTVEVPDGMVGALAPTSGIVLKALAEDGDEVRAGTPLMLIEAMKMEHEVVAPVDGIVRGIVAEPGATVAEGVPLVFLEPANLGDDAAEAAGEVDPDHIRGDLAEVIGRHDELLDARRPEAVAKRHDKGKRTARENLAAIVDDGSFKEYGGLNLAAQRSRRSIEELRRISPADGMIAGFGSVNGDMFDAATARCGIAIYDYSVFVGTQGALNHKKKDRLFELCEREKLPVILFAEGGGGRPGETDQRLGLDIPTFATFAKLRNEVPVISVVSGYCFAGNAALLGCSDVIIATEDASIGMGGPAMIEGGGLGVFNPREVGPAKVQAENGLVDVLVEDEEEGARIAKQVLSYFQGPVNDFTVADQRRLRSIVPENRMRVYAVREVLETLADDGSLLELKPSFGRAMITAFVRIGGTPMGVIANDPQMLSGAIDYDAASKAADFLALCERHGLPVLSLCDTPGFMVGPDVEAAGQVKQSTRLFLAGAKLTVPLFTVVLRKAYGLGAQAMVGGYFHAPFFAVAWPTGEFGAMGLEGAVRLGYRRELAAFDNDADRDAYFNEKLAELYEEGKALTVAEFMEIDDVIDPSDTRDWILRGLEATATRRT